MIFNVIAILGINFLFVGISNGENIAYDKTFLLPGKTYEKKLNYEQKLCIYCYKGISKHLFHIWQTAYFLINLETNEYDLYKGSSVEEVLLMYESHRSSWTNQLFSWKSDKIDIDPFSLNCVGVDTALDHKITLNVIRYNAFCIPNMVCTPNYGDSSLCTNKCSLMVHDDVRETFGIDLWRVVRLALGVCMFFSAPKLSSNPIFYYICGVTLGITTSFLIALYLLSKLIPKKPTVYAFFIGGWAVGVYLFQLLWENLKIIATTYHTHVLMYMVVTGLISFVVCYRFGPVTDPRSKNLIKWAMQVASLILIFYSSRCQEVSGLLMLILLLYYNFPKKWALSFLTLWTRTFPKRPKLLSEDEYHEEGVRETVKALSDLRKYCSSPECNQWKTVLSLQKPLRFAQFMEGSSHLEDSEILAYESESHKSQPLLTDDSDSMEEG